MVNTVRAILLRALDDLDERSFKRFHNKLSDWNIKEGFSKIPRGKLENADREDVVDLILLHYMESYGPKLTVDVLESIDKEQMASDLMKRLENEGEHFVDRHRVELIQGMTLIEPVLDGLIQKGLLTPEQCDVILAEQTPQERMRRLYSFIRRWSNTEKDILYKTIMIYNPSLIRHLEEAEREHSVDRHRVELIQWVTPIEPVLDGLIEKGLLTTEKYDIILAEQTPQERMRRLYSFIRRWSNTEKDILYNTIMICNPSLIRHLEESEGEHFVDRYREELIQWVTEIEPVLDGLIQKGLLTPEQCDTILAEQTPQERMRRLYSFIGGWSNTHKDFLYNTIKIYNPSLIRHLEKSILCSESFQSHGEVLKILPEEASSSSHLDEIDCDLCGKDYDPGDTLVVPDINGNSYRVELTSAGLFRCSETGIKFQVKGPVTIEYEFDSWDNYIECLQHQGSEVLGPLFNIKTPREPHIVCAVYLPHYLCLKELSEDTSWIRCAHFIDGNMSVEKPTRILPFHVVLENPSFSSLGVFCWKTLLSVVTKHIPIHGRVLLYFRVIGESCKEYQLHLYLVPNFAPISKDFEKEKRDMGYVKVDKPPRTRRRIYTERNYIVNGPDEAFIDPTELEMVCFSPMDNFTDITINAAVKIIGLDLVQEDSKDKVWGCRMSTGAIEELQSDCKKTKRPEGGHTHGEHFVDKHRPALIRAISLVEPILEELRSLDLLTDEQYDTVCNKPTSQEQMRELYRYIRYWGDGDKEEVYQILRKHNRPLINRLETEELEIKTP